MIYPRVLNSKWYMENVCDTITTLLEATKQWTKFYYEGDIERDAYVQTFERCQQLVRDHHLKPEAMLQALSDYHDDILDGPKPPLFSRARWFYKPREVSEQAVRAAFDIVDNISKRFLP